MYHSQEDADKAKAYWENTFSKKEIPDEMPEFKPEQYDLVSILIETKLVSSKSEARRVIEQGGVKINGEVIADVNFIVQPNSTLQKGKINFVKII